MRCKLREIISADQLVIVVNFTTLPARFDDHIVSLLAWFAVSFISELTLARSHMPFAMEQKVSLGLNMEQSPKWPFCLPWWFSVSICCGIQLLNRKLLALGGKNMFSIGLTQESMNILCHLFVLDHFFLSFVDAGFHLRLLLLFHFCSELYAQV